MKAITIFFVLSNSLLWQLNAAVQLYAPFNSACSEVRSNIFVSFSNGRWDASSTNDLINFPIDKKIKYGFGSPGIIRHVLTLSDEYSCVVSAKSEAGYFVEKTRLGKKFGSKFSDVEEFDRNKLDTNPTHGTSGRLRPYLSAALPDGIIFNCDLPPLNELFHFEKSGVYTVSVQLQCFVGPYAKANETNVTLVRFPPVQLRVPVVRDEK